MIKPGVGIGANVGIWFELGWILMRSVQEAYCLFCLLPAFLNKLFDLHFFIKRFYSVILINLISDHISQGVGSCTSRSI